VPSHRSAWSRLRLLERELADHGPVLRPRPGLVVVAEPELARSTLIDREGRHEPDSAFFRSAAGGPLPVGVRQRLGRDLHGFLDGLPVDELAESVVTKLSARGRMALPHAGPRLLLEAILPWLARDRPEVVLTAVRELVDEVLGRRTTALPTRWRRPALFRLATRIDEASRDGGPRRCTPDLLDVVGSAVGGLMPGRVVAEVYLRAVTAFLGAPGSALGWCLYTMATRSPGGTDAAGGGDGREFALELLRLWPPVWQISRIAAVDHCVGPVAVHRGETVVVSTFAMHRDPRYWDRPNRFSPGRWLGHTDNPVHVPAFLPFGWGPAACVGAGFSLALLARVAARLQEHVVLPAREPALLRTPHVTQLLWPPRLTVACR
jgi:cytochrome P450